mmetsp:Transcript_42798/g.76964  ORF Transcript_42798/g.76964 Transcript_42798/m.76964 type:complete len:149 (+) Transcript_42798:495-941(+)
MEDDASTIAESSIDSSHITSINSNNKGFFGKYNKRSKFVLKRVSLAAFLLALGVTGVGIYLINGNRQLEDTIDSQAAMQLDLDGGSLGKTEEITSGDQEIEIMTPPADEIMASSEDGNLDDVDLTPQQEPLRGYLPLCSTTNTVPHYH